MVIEPANLPEHAGRKKVLIGEDISERLDVIPARFRVIVTRRPKYAFKDADGVVQALAPAHIIESGLPTEALLAQIAVSKYADGLPLFRQEGIYARDRVEIDRRLMAQWMGRVGFELEILAAHVLGEILKGPRVFADETSLPTLAPGTGAVKKAWLWAYARDDSTFGGSGPPMVAYRFEDSRSGECVRRHLGRYGGILQVSDKSGATSRCARIAAITLRDISIVSSRSRFLVKTVGTQTGSSIPRPTNQRNNRLYCICSISCRSERIENRICSRLARIRRSGAIEGRPPMA